MDLRQTREYGDYMKSQGWVVEMIGDRRSKIGQIQVFVKKLPLLPFSVLKCQRWSGEMDWKKLAVIRKKYRVIYSVIEPSRVDQLTKIKDRGYRLNKNPYLPTKTLVVDLTKTEGQLLKEMSKDARQRLKYLGGRASQKISYQTADLEVFWKEWKKAGKGYVLSLKKFKDLKESFGEKCWIIGGSNIKEDPSPPLAGARFAPVKDHPLIAGAVILIADDTAYYYFAWTNEEGRRVGAQYQLVWEVMKKAKKMGLKKFDFEGLYDSRWPLENWKGFSSFKKKFGGEEVEYPGSWQRWL